jgi:23S rRNA pseudouridine1911/1915/1917 synthase
MDVPTPASTNPENDPAPEHGEREHADGPIVRFFAPADEAGARMDRLIVEHVPGVGRRGAAELFRRGAVRIGQRIAKKGDRPPPGAEITVALGGAEVAQPEPDAPLDVRLETAEVVIVCKPAGQPTAPIRLGERGTLAQALLGRYPELAGIGHREREPGLLHRLDTFTSGLVVAVRTAAAFDVLRAALSDGKLDKRYLAIVTGTPRSTEGVVDLPLARDEKDDRKVRTCDFGSSEGRAARSSFRVVQSGNGFTLLEVKASPASRHQVRVHLAAIGHPIVGDVLYGGVPHPALGERHALHASHVAWAGDARVPSFAADDALPPDLLALMG